MSDKPSQGIICIRDPWIWSGYILRALGCTSPLSSGLRGLHVNTCWRLVSTWLLSTHELSTTSLFSHCCSLLPFQNQNARETHHPPVLAHTHTQVAIFFLDRIKKRGRTSLKEQAHEAKSGLVMENVQIYNLRAENKQGEIWKENRRAQKDYMNVHFAVVQVNTTALTSFQLHATQCSFSQTSFPCPQVSLISLSLARRGEAGSLAAFFKSTSSL